MHNRFYIKISVTFFAMLLLLGLGYIIITTFVAQQYIQESNQKLYGTIADTATVQLKKLIDENGKIDEPKVQDLMHSLMVINPNLEVYLLDKEGNIQTHVAPYKRVKLKKVQLEPVIAFIKSGKKIFIKGEDPRCIGVETVFSAAEIKDGDQLTGYLYIVLMSEEQAAVTSSLFDSYILKVGAQMFFITLLIAFIFGSLTIWYMTKNLSNIIDKVRYFKEGDLQARIENPNDSDWSVLSNTFNEMADTIVANIEQLKSVEQLRRELIGNVSHDLRTPLAIMQGYVETLLIRNERITPAEREKYLNTMLGSSKKLEKLIKQLFEYSKLEAKQIEPVKEAFFLSELAQDVFQKYQILAKEKSITMKMEMQENLPMVFADVSLVDRVIQNLMDNALKFTPEGGSVTIGLKLVGKSVEVRIADTGPGISKELQSHIFERYNKTNAPTNTQGAGLGLAIVKKILELHDATIQVQSKLHQGTVFMFQLPALAIN
jgi:signal transduction histidine kinase